MDIFIIWMAPIAAICVGIMVLTLFFKLIGLASDRVSPVKYLKIKKLLSSSEVVTVHLTSGKTVSNVKFIGFTDQASMKGLPYEMTNLVVFEKENGRRVFIKANAIRIMEEHEESQPSNSG